MASMVTISLESESSNIVDPHTDASQKRESVIYASVDSSSQTTIEPDSSCIITEQFPPPDFHDSHEFTDNNTINSDRIIITQEKADVVENIENDKYPDCRLGRICSAASSPSELQSDQSGCLKKTNNSTKIYNTLELDHNFEYKSCPNCRQFLPDLQQTENQNNGETANRDENNLIADSRFRVKLPLLEYNQPHTLDYRDTLVMDQSSAEDECKTSADVTTEATVVNKLDPNLALGSETENGISCLKCPVIERNNTVDNDTGITPSFQPTSLPLDEKNELNHKSLDNMAYNNDSIELKENQPKQISIVVKYPNDNAREQRPDLQQLELTLANNVEKHYYAYNALDLEDSLELSFNSLIASANDRNVIAAFSSEEPSSEDIEYLLEKETCLNNVIRNTVLDNLVFADERHMEEPGDAIKMNRNPDFDLIQIQRASIRYLNKESDDVVNNASDGNRISNPTSDARVKSDPNTSYTKNCDMSNGSPVSLANSKGQAESNRSEPSTLEYANIDDITEIDRPPTEVINNKTHSLSCADQQLVSCHPQIISDHCSSHTIDNNLNFNDRRLLKEGHSLSHDVSENDQFLPSKEQGISTMCKTHRSHREGMQTGDRNSKLVEYQSAERDLSAVEKSTHVVLQVDGADSRGLLDFEVDNVASCSVDSDIGQPNLVLAGSQFSTNNVSSPTKHTDTTSLYQVSELYHSTNSAQTDKPSLGLFDGTTSRINSEQKSSLNEQNRSISLFETVDSVELEKQAMGKSVDLLDIGASQIDSKTVSNKECNGSEKNNLLFPSAATIVDGKSFSLELKKSSNNFENNYCVSCDQPRAEKAYRVRSCINDDIVNLNIQNDDHETELNPLTVCSETVPVELTSGENEKSATLLQVTSSTLTSLYSDFLEENSFRNGFSEIGTSLCDASKSSADRQSLSLPCDSEQEDELFQLLENIERRGQAIRTDLDLAYRREYYLSRGIYLDKEHLSQVVKRLNAEISSLTSQNARLISGLGIMGESNEKFHQELINTHHLAKQYKNRITVYQEIIARLLAYLETTKSVFGFDIGALHKDIARLQQHLGITEADASRRCCRAGDFPGNNKITPSLTNIAFTCQPDCQTGDRSRSADESAQIFAQSANICGQTESSGSAPNAVRRSEEHVMLSYEDRSAYSVLTMDSPGRQNAEENTSLDAIGTGLSTDSQGSAQSESEMIEHGGTAWKASEMLDKILDQMDSLTATPPLTADESKTLESKMNDLKDEPESSEKWRRLALTPLTPDPIVMCLQRSLASATLENDLLVSKMAKVQRGLNQKVEELSSMLNEKDQIAKSTSERNGDLQKQVDSDQDEIDLLKGRVSTLEKSLSVAHVESDRLMGKLNDALTDVKNAESIVGARQTECEETKDSKVELEMKLASQKEEKKRLLQELEALKEEQSEKDKMLSGLETSLVGAEAERTTLRTEIGTLQEQFDALKAEMETMQSRFDTQLSESKMKEEPESVDKQEVAVGTDELDNAITKELVSDVDSAVSDKKTVGINTEENYCSDISSIDLALLKREASKAGIKSHESERSTASIHKDILSQSEIVLKALKDSGIVIDEKQPDNLIHWQEVRRSIAESLGNEGVDSIEHAETVEEITRKYQPVEKLDDTNLQIGDSTNKPEEKENEQKILESETSLMDQMTEVASKMQKQFGMTVNLVVKPKSDSDEIEPKVAVVDCNPVPKINVSNCNETESATDDTGLVDVTDQLHPHESEPAQLDEDEKLNSRKRSSLDYKALEAEHADLRKKRLTLLVHAYTGKTDSDISSQQPSSTDMILRKRRSIAASYKGSVLDSDLESRYTEYLDLPSNQVSVEPGITTSKDECVYKFRDSQNYDYLQNGYPSPYQNAPGQGSSTGGSVIPVQQPAPVDQPQARELAYSSRVDRSQLSKKAQLDSKLKVDRIIRSLGINRTDNSFSKSHQRRQVYPHKRDYQNSSTWFRERQKDENCFQENRSDYGDDCSSYHARETSERYTSQREDNTKSTYDSPLIRRKDEIDRRFSNDYDTVKSNQLEGVIDDENRIEYNQYSSGTNERTGQKISALDLYRSALRSRGDTSARGDGVGLYGVAQSDKNKFDTNYCPSLRNQIGSNYSTGEEPLNHGDKNNLSYSRTAEYKVKYDHVYETANPYRDKHDNSTSLYPRENNGLGDRQYSGYNPRPVTESSKHKSVISSDRGYLDRAEDRFQSSSTSSRDVLHSSLNRHRSSHKDHLNASLQQLDHCGCGDLDLNDLSSNNFRHQKSDNLSRPIPSSKILESAQRTPSRSPSHRLTRDKQYELNTSFDGETPYKTPTKTIDTKPLSYHDRDTALNTSFHSDKSDLGSPTHLYNTEALRSDSIKLRTTAGSHTTYATDLDRLSHNSCQSYNKTKMADLKTNLDRLTQHEYDQHNDQLRNMSDQDSRSKTELEIKKQDEESAEFVVTRSGDIVQRSTMASPNVSRSSRSASDAGVTPERKTSSRGLHYQGITHTGSDWVGSDTLAYRSPSSASIARREKSVDRYGVDTGYSSNRDISGQCSRAMINDDAARDLERRNGTISSQTPCKNQKTFPGISENKVHSMDMYRDPGLRNPSEYVAVHERNGHGAYLDRESDTLNMSGSHERLKVDPDENDRMTSKLHNKSDFAKDYGKAFDVTSSNENWSRSLHEGNNITGSRDSLVPGERLAIARDLRKEFDALEAREEKPLTDKTASDKEDCRGINKKKTAGSDLSDQQRSYANVLIDRYSLELERNDRNAGTGAPGVQPSLTGPKTEEQKTYITEITNRYSRQWQDRQSSVTTEEERSADVRSDCKESKLDNSLDVNDIITRYNQEWQERRLQAETSGE